MPSIHIQSKAGPKEVTVDVSDEHASKNYEALEKAVSPPPGHKVVVLSADGGAVRLVPSEVDSSASYKYVVLEMAEPEVENTGTHWEHHPEDENITSLKEKYEAQGARRKNAALNGYTGDGKGQPDLIFPDYNTVMRDAYSHGIASQIPKSFVQIPDDSNHVAGLPHEPTMGSLATFKAELLRWALLMGFKNENKKAADAMPTARELREAHRVGKEAVCISISEEDWGQVTLDMFKKCAVPIEYAAYEGGQDKKLRDTKEYREALRRVFLAGVEDAWKAREKECVTQVKASMRVPSSPDLQDAFQMGVKASKHCSGYATGCHLELTESNEIIVNGECHEKYLTTRKAFELGLKASWNSYSGEKIVKPDVKFPDTGAEEKEAYKAGVTLKHQDEKKKEELKRREEARAAAEEKEPSFVEEIVHGLKECCKGPFVTEDPNGHKLLCGTSLGDWCLILLCFAVYYTFLGMWYWTFIEILMAVAEPKRPMSG